MFIIKTLNLEIVLLIIKFRLIANISRLSKIKSQNLNFLDYFIFYILLKNKFIN